MKNNINQTPENQEMSSGQKVKNFIKDNTHKAIAPVLIAGAILTANEVKGQTTWTLDPANNYTMQNPDTLPNMPDRSTINVVIKTGANIPITIDGMDPNSTTLLRNPDGTSLPLNNITNNVINLNKPGTRNREYKSGGSTKATTLQVSYQVDGFDRTEESPTINQRPRFIRVAEGKQATFSAGSKINPDGSNLGYYGLQDSNGNRISAGYADSTYVQGKGTYTLNASDQKGNTSTDIISVVEKPAINHQTKQVNFPSTENGVRYKVFSKPSTGGTWTLLQEFIGDGNTKSIQGTDNTFIKTELSDGTVTESNLPPQKIDYTLRTGINEPEQSKFRIQDRNIIRPENVEFYICNMNGTIIDSGHGTSSTVKAAGVYIVTSKDESGKTQSKKVIIK